MIPAEVVEAVAIAWTGEREWQLHSQPWRSDRLEEVGQILEAAMPHALATAWDEGEAAGQDNADSNRGHNIAHKYNPYRSEA